MTFYKIKQNPIVNFMKLHYNNVKHKPKITIEKTYMNTQTTTLLNKIRQTLETNPSNITFGKINSAAYKIDNNIIAPEYSEFLRVSNGIRCGITELFSAEYIKKNQYTAEHIDGGKELWFCIGQVLYQPLLINLQNHNVYLFYNSYFYDDRTENSYRNLGKFDDFLTDFIFGKRYSELIPDIKIEYDKWYIFLKEIHLI